MSARKLIAVVWTISSAVLGDGQDMVILTQYEKIMIPVFLSFCLFADNDFRLIGVGSEYMGKAKFNDILITVIFNTNWI